MLFSAVSVLASALLVTAAPSISGRQAPLTAIEIFFVGSETCGPTFEVNGTITTGICQQILLPSLEVQEQDVPCTYQQFQGTNCTGALLSTADIPAGSGFSDCIATNVVDGGAHIEKSALYTC